MQKESEKKLLAAYQDRIAKHTFKDLFILLYEMRFKTKRTYHGDGATTLHLPPELADRLENVFEDQANNPF